MKSGSSIQQLHNSLEIFKIKIKESMLAVDNSENSEKWEEINNAKPFLVTQNSPHENVGIFLSEEESVLFLKPQLLLHLGKGQTRHLGRHLNGFISHSP